MIVGIPRALMYHHYGECWLAFLDALGVEAVVSECTTDDIITNGAFRADNETCLPVKVFSGHLLWLMNRVDAVLVPRVVSQEHGTCSCPKFMGLPVALTEAEFRRPRRWPGSSRNSADTVFERMPAHPEVISRLVLQATSTTFTTIVFHWACWTVSAAWGQPRLPLTRCLRDTSTSMRRRCSPAGYSGASREGLWARSSTGAELRMSLESSSSPPSPADLARL